MTTVKSLSRYFYCNNFDPQVNSSYLPPRPTVKNEGTRTEKPGLARRCWSRDDTPAAGVATTLLIRVLRTLDGMSVLHLDAESQTIQDPLCLASPFLLEMLFTYGLSIPS